jgi:predicted ATPase
VPQEAGFVGRRQKLHQLQEHWAATLAGHGRVVLIAGEPGIGKTRLAGELCGAVHDAGATVLLGRCFEDVARPYGPWIDALSQYIAACPAGELRLVLGNRRSELAQLLPALGGSAAIAPIPHAAQGDEQARHRLFDAVAGVLREAAHTRPAVIVLDDLHWADAPSLLLLRHLVRNADRAPLMVLGTYRQTELDEAHPLTAAIAELRRARALERIVLKGLPADGVAELISIRFGRQAPESFARAVHARTEGNPFFVEELLHEAIEAGDWGQAIEQVGVPESVKDVLARRLRRLEEPCRRVLDGAAVAGRDFDLDVLARVTATMRTCSPKCSKTRSTRAS